MQFFNYVVLQKIQQDNISKITRNPKFDAYNLEA